MRSTLTLLVLFTLAVSAVTASSSPSTASSEDLAVDHATLRKAVHEALSPLIKPNDGSTSCLLCTLLTSLLSRAALATSQTPDQVFTEFCKGFTGLFQTVCNIAKDALELFGLKSLDPKMSPEAHCQKQGSCPSPATCVLYPTWPPKSSVPNPVQALSGPRPMIPGGNDLAQDITQLINLVATGLKANIQQVFDDHKPMKSDDADGDMFAVRSAFRGFSWRGKDCDDSDAEVYPGRRYAAATSKDHNCNGISGAASNGTSYETLYCGTNAPRSTIVFGDSASAHFRIPPFVLSGSQTFNTSNWKGLLHWAMNEADWPECSGWTAFANATDCPKSYADGEISSLYKFMFERNRCNHRNYQSIAVNGARTSNMMPPDGTMGHWTRDQDNDDPALVMLALIGNDVCSGHPDFSHMTTPSEFEANVLKMLTYLDTQLPANSTVVFVPLADGLLLHDILHNRTHPLGVTYSQLYDYLICEGKAPCWGWMNNNATVRNLTQQRADELSAVYPKIVAEHSYKHFDMIHVPPGDMKTVVQKWIADGKDPAELIEPSDGFHPSQTSQVLTARYVWQWLETNHPEAIGPINPYNAEIVKMFGDQGGYV